MSEENYKNLSAAHKDAVNWKAEMNYSRQIGQGRPVADRETFIANMRYSLAEFNELKLDALVEAHKRASLESLSNGGQALLGLDPF